MDPELARLLNIIIDAQTEARERMDFIEDLLTDIKLRLEALDDSGLGFSQLDI